MGVISIVGVWAGLVLLGVGTNTRDRIAGWIAIVGGFGCGLTSVSRAPIIIGALMILIWGLFYRASLSSGLRLALAGILISVVIMYSGVLPTFLELGDGLILRAEESNDTFQERAFGQFVESYEAFSLAPLGAGLGTEQVAGNYFRSGEMKFTTFENQLPRIIMDTGILGLLGFLVICLGALGSLQAAKRNALTESERSVQLATQLLLASMFYTNVVFNHTASAFAWLIFAATLASAGARVPSAEGTKV